MSACLGWPGPCPEHGQFHGCEKENDHKLEHHCACGATIGNKGRDIKNPYHELSRVPA